MESEVMWWENSDEKIKCYNMNTLTVFTMIGGIVPLSILIRKNSKNLKIDEKERVNYIFIALLIWGLKMALEATIVLGKLSFSFININLLYICISLGIQYKYYLNIKSTYRIYKVSIKEFESPFNEWLKPFMIVLLLEFFIMYLLRMV